MAGPDRFNKSKAWGSGASTVSWSQLEAIRLGFTSGGSAGTADDVTIFNTANPVNIRICAYDLYVSAAVLLATISLRSAAGGGGNLYLELNSASTPGRRGPLDSTQSPTVVVNGSLYMRRSDRSVEGELILYVTRI